MRFLIIMILLLTIMIIPISTVYGYSSLTKDSNQLQNTELNLKNAVIELKINFGVDNIQPLLNRDITKPSIDNIDFSFYGDKIELNDMEFKVFSNGNVFRISSLNDGILMYGLKDKNEYGNYRVNIYISTNTGLEKFTVCSDVPKITHRADKENGTQLDKYKKEIKSFDNPKLHVLTDHYKRVLKDDTWRFEIKTFDNNMYDGKEWDNFYGKIDGVSVNATIKDSDGTIKEEFTGKTKYGIFKGEIIPKGLIYPTGNYRLYVDVTYENQTFSKNLDFAIFEENTVFNNNPISNAGIDGHYASGVEVTLSGVDSTDQDDNYRGYTWTQTEGLTVELLPNNKIVNPKFTMPDVIDTFVFSLVVDDSRKKSLNTDYVTITSLHSNAGLDQNTPIGLITLDGSNSGDALSHTLSYSWEIIKVPDTSLITNSDLSDSSLINPTFTPDIIGDYIIQLSVNDGTLTDTDTVTIIIIE